MKKTITAGAVAVGLAAFTLTACQSGDASDPQTTVAQTEQAPSPEEPTAQAAEAQTTEPVDEATASPTGIDGTWCPTPESSDDLCVTIILPNATYEDGTTAELFLANEDDDGVTEYGMADAPFGTYYPAGVAVDIPDYYPGADLPDQDRIWNGQTGTLLVRQ